MMMRMTRAWKVTEYRYKKGGDPAEVDGSLPGVEWLTRLGERRRGLTKDQIIIIIIIIFIIIIRSDQGPDH